LNFDSKAQEITSTMQTPDEEDMRSYLLEFRKFLMNDEPIFFDRVINQAIRCMQLNTTPSDTAKHAAHLKILMQWRNAWRQEYRKKYYVIIDDKELTAEATTALAFYGGIFHDTDEDKSLFG
jgi:hypothetical protein